MVMMARGDLVERLEHGGILERGTVASSSISVGRQRARAGYRHAAAFPDPRLSAASLATTTQRAGILEDLFHAHGLVGDLRRVPVHFNEQDGRRVTRQTDIHVILNIVDGRVVHEFQRTGDNMRGDDPATACEARFTSGKMAIMALEALGGVTSLRTALLVSASVPSEATSSSVRL